MIARITGTVESLEGNRATIAPRGGAGEGLGYEVLLPAYLASSLLVGMTSDPVITLHTIQYLESVNQGSSFIPRLIGFSSTREREFFELLTTVKGLGNKRALRAMAMEPGAIARAIAERDARFLQSLPEIGPKLAELIIHELKSKVDSFVGMGAGKADVPSAAPAVEPKPVRSKKVAAAATDAPSPRAAAPAAAPPRRLPIRETVDALIALGETPIDAERLVARAVDRAKASGEEMAVSAGDLLTMAYAAR